MWIVDLQRFLVIHFTCYCHILFGTIGVATKHNINVLYTYISVVLNNYYLIYQDIMTKYDITHDNDNNAYAKT